MTADQVAELALSRAMEHSEEVPATRSLMYHRIGVRQQELFGLAARINPDFYGVCAKASLRDELGAWVGAASLMDLGEVDTPKAEHVSRVEVYDAGSSELEVGVEVHIVPLSDTSCAFPPRVTLRNHTLRQVGVDLVGVEKLEVFYSRMPLSIGPAGGDIALELPEQYQTLLVVDCARDLFRRSTALPGRPALVAMMDQEEAPVLADYLLHVQRFAGALVSRFDTQTRPALP